MVSHENWDFPENSRNVPMRGLHTSVWPDTTHGGCRSHHVFGWATVPLLRLRHRNQGLSANFHLLTCNFQTHISLSDSQRKQKMRHRAQHQAVCMPRTCMQPSRKYVCAHANLRHSHVKACLAPGGCHTWDLSYWALPTQATRWTSFRPLTEGSWGPKNGDCHLVVASILTDGDVLGISNHVLPHQVQVRGTVWRVERTRTVTFKILFFISNFIFSNYTKQVCRWPNPFCLKTCASKAPV